MVSKLSDLRKQRRRRSGISVGRRSGISVEEYGEYAPLVAAMRRRVRPSVGKVTDRCTLIIPVGDEPPKGEARCPACKTATSWRGPHPGLKDPLIEKRATRTGFREVVILPPDNVPRSEQTRILYRRADVHTDAPQDFSLLPGHVLWQGALCGPCEATHMAAWMDATYPQSGMAGKQPVSIID